VTDRWLVGLQTTGSAGGYMSLLGVQATNNLMARYPDAFTEEAYRAYYGG